MKKIPNEPILLIGTKWYGNFQFFVYKALKQRHDNTSIMYLNVFSLWDRLKTFKSPSKKHKLKYQHIQQYVLKNKPWLIILFNSSSLSAHEIHELKKISSKTIIANWLIDDPWRLNIIKTLPECTVLFSGDMHDIHRLRKKTSVPVHFLSDATDPSVFYPLGKKYRKYQCDIAFVGCSYDADESGLLRGKYCNALVLQGYSVKIYGDPGWNLVTKTYPALSKCIHGYLRAGETNKLYNSATIVLNIHHLQNKKKLSQRAFDISASKGFQLVEYKNIFTKLFPKNANIFFRSEKDLLKKAALYINNNKKRASIANINHEHVLKEHTFQHRTELLLAKALKKYQITQGPNTCIQ